MKLWIVTTTKHIVVFIEAQEEPTQQYFVAVEGQLLLESTNLLSSLYNIL